MNSRLLTGMIPVMLFTGLALPKQLVAQSTRYKIIDLGTLGGPMSHHLWPGLSLTNSGTMIAVAGIAVLGHTITDPYAPKCLDDCVLSHAIKWEKGVITDLGALPGLNGNDSVASWMSPNGLIAGFSENGLIDPLTGFPQLAAILWNRDGSIVTLGGFGGNSSQTNSINSRGQIVGVALNTTPDSFATFMNFGIPAATQARAFLWQNSSMRDLGTLGGDDATALMVNEGGQVVGYSFTLPNDKAMPPGTMPPAHPFLWENGRMLDLGSLGGTVAVPGPLSVPGGVNLNNRGEVVGSSTLAGDTTWHPFLWVNGVMKDLGTLGGRNGEAYFISDSGLVVGRADVSSQNTIHRAFLWKNGAMTDLGVLA
jgi:probable HAF family extracellular repeat protein